MPIDRRQFAQTILEDQHKLIAYVLARGGAHQVAEDVVQDVLALAFERMETFSDADHLRAWCREAARRTFLAHLRDNKRQPLAIDQKVLESASVDNAWHSWPEAVTDLGEKHLRA